eukprot:3008173-Pyramimonas_sp.AAC.1
MNGMEYSDADNNALGNRAVEWNAMAITSHIVGTSRCSPSPTPQSPSLSPTPTPHRPYALPPHLPFSI